MRTAIVLALLVLPLASAQYTTTDVTITSHDETNLNARLYMPEETPAPAILLTHGWGEDINQGNPKTYAERYADLGYVVLAYDSRGWGQSEGMVELNGPNEVKDAQELISYLAGLDEVILDGTDDPRLGMVGQSYAGGIQLLTAQVDPRIDAIAPFSTWGDLLHSLGPNDVVKRGWVDLFFASGQTGAAGIPLGSSDPSRYDPDAGVMSPDLARWYAAIQANNGPDDEVREEIGVVRSIDTSKPLPPTFLAQGWPDTLFAAEDALATFNAYRYSGTDIRLNLYDMGHGGFGNYADEEPIMERLDDFMAQHLRGEDPQLPPYPVFRYRYAQDDFVGEMSWPPAGTTPNLYYITDDGLSIEPGAIEQTLIVPPVPAQCTEVSNFQGETADQCGQGVDGTYMTFAAPAFDGDTEVTGTPQVIVPFTTTQSEAFLFFQLVDIAPDGSETSVLSQVKPVRPAADAGSVFVNLHTISHTFADGHAVGLKIATTDLTYSGSREPGQITLAGAAGTALMAIPTVAADAHGDQSSPSIQRAFTPASTDNQTEVIKINLRDNLALGNHTVVGNDAAVDVMVESVSPRHRILTITATATCGIGNVTIGVEDLAGLRAERSYDVVPCPEITPEDDDDSDKKKSPGGWIIMPILAALALHGKVRRAR